MTQQFGNRDHIGGASTATPYERRDMSADDGGTAQDKAREMSDRASEKANEAKDRAMDQAERGREKAAEGTESAADKIRESTEGHGGMQEKAGTKLADAMDRTSGSLRENRTDEIWNDLEQLARERPMQALGGAVIAGFVLGRILR
jgi:ElaB/YqjD/DUF883 family membrane-anchored ribosome-binding protein